MRYLSDDKLCFLLARGVMGSTIVGFVISVKPADATKWCAQRFRDKWLELGRELY